MSRVDDFIAEAERLRAKARVLPWTDIEIADIERGNDVVSVDRVDEEFVLAAVNSHEAMLRVVRAAEELADVINTAVVVDAMLHGDPPGRIRTAHSALMDALDALPAGTEGGDDA